MTILENHAQEEGTYYITISCKNKNGVLTAPSVLKWTLTDLNGTTINDRKDVNVASPSHTEELTLTGDDLALQSGEIGMEVQRVLLITGTLDAQNLVGRVYFTIDNMEGI